MFIGDMIEVFSIEIKDKPAIIFEEKVITYKEFFQQVTLLKHHLNRLLGTIKGKKIGFLLHNNPKFLELFFATITSGGIAMPFDPKWSTRELQAVLDEVQPDIFIVADEFISRLKKEKIDNVEIVFWDCINSENSENYKTSNEQTAIIPIDKASEEDLFYIGYTSGTTGKPKGFMRTHLSWLKSFESGADVFRITKEDLICAPGPLYHSLNLFAAVHALHIGASIHILRSFNAKTVIQLLKTTPIHVIYLVPTMSSAIFNQLDGTREVITNVRKLISSGAKWHTASKQKLRLFFPYANLYEFYGASELSWVSVLNNEDNLLAPQSVGKPFSGIEIQIRDEKGATVNLGSVGKIYIKSDQVFKGYVNDEIGTREVLQGEWATVGDLGYVDDNGYLYIVGRDKNKIISGGLNIYPEEIEMVLEKHATVAEAVVIGVEDHYWGEMVVAIVRCNEGQKFDESQLKTFCRKELSTYKCPRIFIEVPSFSYTSSGKIARREVDEVVKRKLVERKEQCLKNARSSHCAGKENSSW